MRTHPLPGLRPQPYASYLAALGLLRLTAEQVEPTVQGWWQGGHFHLASDTEPKNFLLHHYAPTPIASPWNGGSGFHPGEDATPRETIANSTDVRFTPYRQTLAAIAQTLDQLGMTDKPSSLQQKSALLKALQNSLPKQGRLWFDAVLTIDDEPTYSRLFFSGGNDAKFEMSRPFLANLHQLFLDPDRKPLASSQALQALLDDHAAPVLSRQTHGAMDPFTVAATNGTSDGDSTYLANPWRYILALEGLIALAPHQQALSTPASIDEGQDDLLLPIWSDPLTLAQVNDLLKTGQTATYQRYSVPRRNGKAHFVIPVSHLPLAPSWRRILSWLKRNRRNDSALRTALQQDRTQALEELGKLRLHSSDTPKLYEEILPPDGAAEYQLAQSLAGIGYNLSEPLHLRPHMSHFQGRDLCEKMIRLTRHRIHAGSKVYKHPNHAGIVLFNDPFWSRQPSSPRHIRSFLQGQTHDARLSNLLHALCLVETPPQSPEEEGEEAALLPYPYRLIKLAFAQHAQDRRPAPIAILDHLCAQRWDAALDTAHRFLRARHPALPSPLRHAWTGDARRVAAALLFPISTSTYQRLLSSVKHPTLPNLDDTSELWDR